MDRDSIPSTRG